MKEKSWFDNFLGKLIKANEEEFGDKPLDCCGLNKNMKYENPDHNDQKPSEFKKD